MNNDIGFFAMTLENNAFHNTICELVAGYIKHNPQNQIVIFNQYSEKIDTHDIPILPLSYSKFYNGDLITFDIASLLLSVNSISANNIYFYAQNIPWQISYNKYNEWKNIFGNKKINVIANNEYIHNIYNIAWNNSIGVCEDLTYEKFSKFIR